MSASPKKDSPVSTPSVGRAILNDLFAIDLRSLALFRIGMALILLWDLISRCREIGVWYTDDGLLPRSAVQQVFPFFYRWDSGVFFSFHYLFGSVAGQAVLFTIAIVFAFLLLMGWRTRLVTFISWLFLISLHMRNPLILQGGDTLLRVLMFWALFLPLGARFSWDERRERKRNPDAPQPLAVLSMASAGLLLQVAFVYIFTVLLKSDPLWRTGDAVYVALQCDIFTRPLGVLLSNFPPLTFALTRVTMWVEGFGPFLAFFPLNTGPVRTGVVILFLLFHLVGINLCMILAHFPYMCAVAWIVYLPAWAWERKPLNWLERKWERGGTEAAPTGFMGLGRGWNIVCAVYILLICLWNVRALGVPGTQRALPRVLDPLVTVPYVAQYWALFAPKPMTEDGWYLIPGKLRDGSEVDLYQSQMDQTNPERVLKPVSEEKPDDIAITFASDRWRKYLLNIYEARRSGYRVFWARWLCRTWNQTHPEDKQLVSFDICFMREDTMPPYRPPLMPIRLTLFKGFTCEGNAKTSATTNAPRVSLRTVSNEESCEPCR